MEIALTNHLLGGVALVALVGQRITWGVRPQSSPTPSLVLHKISGAPLYADEGEVGLSTARIQVDCWAKDANGESGALIAKRVAIEVMGRLSGVSFNQDGVEFQGVFAEEDGQDSFELGAGGEGLHRSRLGFIVWYS